MAAAGGLALLVVAAAMVVWLRPHDKSLDTNPSGSPDTTAPATFVAGKALDPPRFEDARIVVRPGQDRAYVGYTIEASGPNQYANVEDIRSVGADGRVLEWRIQTATGGPADVTASGRYSVDPALGPNGSDAYYFEASSLRVGETVRVTFTFTSGPLEVPFRVVQGG